MVDELTSSLCHREVSFMRIVFVFLRLFILFLKTAIWVLREAGRRGPRHRHHAEGSRHQQQTIILLHRNRSRCTQIANLLTRKENHRNMFMFTRHDRGVSSQSVCLLAEGMMWWRLSVTTPASNFNYFGNRSCFSPPEDRMSISEGNDSRVVRR